MFHEIRLGIYQVQLAFMFPFTSNFSDGVVVHIQTSQLVYIFLSNKSLLVISSQLAVTQSYISNSQAAFLLIQASRFDCDDIQLDHLKTHRLLRAIGAQAQS